MGSNPLADQLISILKRNGFPFAAESEIWYRTNNRILRSSIASWSNYPACMNIYPTVLTKKPIYEGEF